MNILDFNVKIEMTNKLFSKQAEMHRTNRQRQKNEMKAPRKNTLHRRFAFSSAQIRFMVSLPVSARSRRRRYLFFRFPAGNWKSTNKERAGRVAWVLEKVGARARHRMGSSECLREETIKPCVRIKRERCALYFRGCWPAPHRWDRYRRTHTRTHSNFLLRHPVHAKPERKSRSVAMKRSSASPSGSKSWSFLICSDSAK